MKYVFSLLVIGGVIYLARFASHHLDGTALFFVVWVTLGSLVSLMIVMGKKPPIIICREGDSVRAIYSPLGDNRIEDPEAAKILANKPTVWTAVEFDHGIWRMQPASQCWKDIRVDLGDLVIQDRRREVG